jgi:hypothetical protein
MLRRSGFHWLFAAAIVAAYSSPTSAQVFWGVRGDSSVGDIRSGGGQSNFTFNSAGGAGIPVAEVMIDDSVTPDSFGNGPWNRGTTHGFAGLNFAANTPPSLKAEAILTGNRSSDFRFGSLPAGAVAFAGMFASDIFQYTGPAPTTLSIAYTLEGVVSDPAGDAVANPLTSVAANVAVFADTPNYRFVADVGTLVAELGATLKQHNGVDAVDLATLTIDNDTGGAVATVQTTLMFDVVPGETFYVWQTLGANAAFGTRLVDAFSTLNSEFNQPQFVRSLSVPEPAGVVLLGLAAACMLRRHLRAEGKGA